MPDFDEVRLPTDISKNAVMGPGYNTVVVVAATAEQRVSLWSVGRLTGEISYSNQHPNELAYLVAFFRARKGKARGFRFQDLSDYVAFQEPLVNGGGVTLQLIKTYSSGGQSEVRTIVKPVNGTVTLYQNGVLLTSGYTLDYTTGIVTLTTAAPGAILTWSGHFDVPVRFDVDRMQYEHPEVTMLHWDKIPIVELSPDEFLSGSDSGTGGNGPLLAGVVSGSRVSGGNQITGTGGSGGVAPYNYQWLRSLNGGAYTVLSGATTLSYLDTTALISDTAAYQLQVTDSAATSVTSHQITSAQWTMPQ